MSSAAATSDVIRPELSFMDAFRNVSWSAAGDLYARAKSFAGIAYHQQLDKGSPDSIWHHVDEVKDRVKANYEGRVSSERLLRLKALAIMHEVLELQGSNGDPYITTAHLLDAGFDREFVKDLEALSIVKGMKYLDAMHRLTDRPDAMLVKMCDLEVNMQPRKIDPRAFSQTLRDKKAVLYPATHAYFTAFSEGAVDPSRTSITEFTMNNRMLPADVRNLAILQKHSSDTATYRKIWGMPGWMINAGRVASNVTRSRRMAMLAI